ncbi:MAG: DNA polymerase III subunit alpha, partial [Planctomycetes bacterium]|nr:DNA polymerase III subunit alpha [Planctomycetota bacterium]
EFAHLNVHSHFSVLQGLCHLGPLIKRCTETGMKHLAITDNANMFASIDFFKACQSADIKPIIGMTVYIAPENCREHRIQEGVRIGRRLVLLAKDYKGYQTLCRLSSLAYVEGFYFKPRIDREVLKADHEGLVILSGGMGSELHDALSKGSEQRARETIEFYKNLVGEENYYIEIQRTGIEELDTVNPQVFDLAAEYNIDCVATNDVYYVEKEDTLPHEILMCVGQQRLLNDASRPRFSTDEFYLKTPDEMAELFSDKPECIANALKVAELCNLEFPPRQYHLPVFPTPDNMSVEEYFDLSCLEGLRNRYGDDLPANILERYEVEKGVILRTGFPTYFLIVAEFIAKAREMDIPVGPGRGSAAGSIVAYAMEITDIDPMRFDLLFERVLNEERVSMPDIDIDFCQERRKEVIQYVVEKYGRDNVSMIATFGTMKAKGVIRDVGRVLNVDLKQVDKMCKMIADAKNLKVAVEENFEFKELVEADDESKKHFDLSCKLESTIRSIGTHAAGVVIADKDLKEYLPLYRADDTISTQFTMTSVEEDCGLLKMDFLGLQNLTVIKKAVEMIRETRGIEVDVRGLPLDDMSSYELLQRGETAGVFQFESEGMQNLLKRAKPDKFEDVVALLALYRPGPLGSGMDKVFVECKNGLRDIEYPHPLCESELSETYGIILYQEQVMRLANKLANFTLKEADNLRKAMGKKKVDVMMKFKSKFIEGSVSNGLPQDVAEGIFDLMLEFAKYGFNKSHSVAYAYVSYQTAYLKAHFPQEFMAALMTCDIRNIEKIAFFREECRRMKVEVLPPHVNESAYDFRVVNGKVRFGLGGAKGVGIPAVEGIVEAREKDGDYISFDEFIERVDLSRCGKTAIESLIKAGGLDDLGANRCQMFEGVLSAMKIAQSESKKTEQGQMMLFTVEEDEGDEAPKNSNLPDLPEWPERDKLAKEKEVLGFYVSSHPLASVQRPLRYFSSINLLQLADLEEGSELCIGGIISSSAHRFYRENKKMYNFHFEDLSTSIDCVYFCPENDKYGHLLVDDEIVFLVGRAGKDRVGDPSIRVSRIIPLEEAELHLSSSLALHLDYSAIEEEKMRDLRKLTQQYKGRTPIYIIANKEGSFLQFKLDDQYSVSLEPRFLEQLLENYDKKQIEVRKYNKSLLGGRRW